MDARGLKGAASLARHCNLLAIFITSPDEDAGVLSDALYRLSRSKYQNHFVLKGAMLFILWAPTPNRTTGDLDVLGYGSAAFVIGAECGSALLRRAFIGARCVESNHPSSRHWRGQGQADLRGHR